MRRPAAALCLAATLAAGGCLAIDQTITLQKDMTGTAAVDMSLDMEPMVVMIATMQHMMSGGTGDPPADAIERARQEMLAEMKDDPVDFAAEEKELRESMPKGVSLIDAVFKQDGLKFIVKMALGFDKLERLNEIEVKPPDAGVSMPLENPFGNPFEGLTVVEENGTILITGPTKNPFAEAGAKPGDAMDAQTRAMMAPFTKGFRVASKINAPFEILEHNATRREGTTLIWEYDFAAIEKVLDGGPMPAMRVRYKK